jgi:opine dehydrogenase
MKFAAFPADCTDALAAKVRKVFPAIRPVDNLLGTVFPYTNAIHHPPALLLNVGRVESTGGDYRHYFEGITPSVGRVIDALDEERRSVAAAFDVAVDPLPLHFFNMGYTDEKGLAGGTAYATFQNSEPNRFIKAPSTIDHRFFNEDVPFGLLPLTELGKMAHIDMPASNAIITIASIVTGKAYRSEGLTLSRMGIAGLTMTELRRLLQKGYD